MSKTGKSDSVIELNLAGQDEPVFVTIPNGKQYDFYISGPIDSPDHYVNWFHLIRSASEDDVIIFHINSPGGDLSTAIQFRRVFDECTANIVTSIEGSCHSAASVIFLGGLQYSISNHSSMLIHNYSTATGYAKGGELYDQLAFERKWSERLLRDYYEGFLSEAEIVAVLDNKDIWLDSEGILARLDLRNEHFTKLQEEEEKKVNKPKKSPKQASGAAE